MSRVLASMAGVALLGAVAWARAEGGSGKRADDNKPALRADDPVSELGVARIADENGDASLGAALSGEFGRTAQLLAVRAAPYAFAPESLWARLVELACGRDPALAPEAAAALTASERRLVPSELAEREVLLSDLHSLAPKLACAAGTAAPRADIAASVARFEARFQGLLAELAAP
jgi:hypothetical protein